MEVRMNIEYTDHARKRMQQRNVPILITEWLITYGDKQHDHHGGTIRYFTKKCRQRLKNNIGTPIYKRIADFTNSYLVEINGTIITVGKCYKHIKRY